MSQTNQYKTIVETTVYRHGDITTDRQTYYGDHPWTTGNKCKCCGGTGTQRGNDGIRRHCPCCGGTGKETINPLRDYDHYDPWHHFNPITPCWSPML